MTWMFLFIYLFVSAWTSKSLKEFWSHCFTAVLILDYFLGSDILGQVSLWWIQQIMKYLYGPIRFI